jgi:hypothetical protein
MAYHIVINLIGLENVNLENHRVDEVIPAGEVMVNDKRAAEIWEAPDKDYATAQAEILWEQNIPARIVKTREEEKRFVMQLILMATPLPNAEL